MPKIVDNIELLSISEACKQYKSVIGRDTLRNLIQRGEIPTCMIGKRKFTTKQALSRYFAEKAESLR